MPGMTPEEIDKLSDMWANAYASTHEQYSKTEPLSDQQMFAELYQDIVLNSPAIHTILGVEHSYSVAMREQRERKEREVRERTEECMRELEDIKNTAEKNGSPLSDEQINHLYSSHFENLEFLESTWESELSLLRDTQRNEFREWLNTVSEDLHSNEGKITYSDSSTKLSQIAKCSEPDLEESFTIYLGTQLKTMHNIRLLVMDPVDLCRSNVDEAEGTFSRDPKRMQTALTLYSNNLSALVMVVGNRVRYSSDFMTTLSDICSKNCEFHFPDLDQQLQTVQDDIVRLNCKRFSTLYNGNGSNENSASGSNELILPSGSTNSGENTSDQVSLASSQFGVGLQSGATSNPSPHLLSANQSGGNSSPSLSHLSPQHQRKFKALLPGDVFITRHSNLSAVHAVFHLAGDSKVEAFDMTSQHPTFTGLKNIFRFAIDFDIINIYIPLLLTDTISDDKTLELCVKRAELVFKCVKGFMIEATTWTTTKSRTIQFLLPRKSSAELFHQLRRTLQETFPISNPVVTKVNSNPA
ncbi:ferry endosomal RAB5 effector complex subunit 3-like [Convolutriloba macropyga]|uniref:ferry endosomal RAB5 effector complex subunit 3-like n=1 Tax=Convolutriloba macropyga TaxID=536237 RepID=UPI003F51C9BA